MSAYYLLKMEFEKHMKQGMDSKCLDTFYKKYASTKHKDSDFRTNLDQSFREFLLRMMTTQEHDMAKWEVFVNLSIETSRLELCNTTLPVVLLGDIFEMATLDWCEKMFTFVENGVKIWKEPLFFSPCKNNLLRMCNDLLRRLSRSQNTIFCGRILLFLAKFFPFSERSGLNIVSEFNLDNVTEFTKEEEGGADTAAIASLIPEEEKSNKIEFGLYCKFWGLQDFFRNPNQCYNKTHWKTFTTNGASVLSVFESHKLEAVDMAQQNPVQDTWGTTDEGGAHYFAKYLTNQKLLELQLNDTNFRRQVLVQFLITFQYLRSPVKFKSESQELKADQLQWIIETTENVHKLLVDTPPNGEKFLATTLHLLKREERWSGWKNDGCPEFRKPEMLVEGDATEDGSPVEKRRKLPSNNFNEGWKNKSTNLGDIIKQASVNNKFEMGSTELTKLWNLCPDNIDACESKERDFLPALETYFQEAIEQSDPDAMVEETYKRVNDSNFGWRALRLLAKRSPHFFTQSNNPINKLPDYLENMVKKINKDRTCLSSEDSTRNKDLFSSKPEISLGADEDEGLIKSSSKSPAPSIDPDKLDSLSELIGSLWRTVAAKLGYKEEEMDDLQTEYLTDVRCAKSILEMWILEDDDFSAETMAYALESFGIEASHIIFDKPLAS